MSDRAASLFDIVVSLITSKTAIVSTLSFLAGAVLSLFTPWNKWIIEKRRTKLDNRKEKVRKWRDEIDKHDTFVTFSQTSTFQDLKDRLKDEEVRTFYMGWLDENPNIDTEKSKLMRFHQIVSEYEKEWKII